MTKTLDEMTTLELQQELSAILCIMQKLDGQIGRRSLIRASRREDQFSKSRSEKDRLYDMLQWIALCFMTGGVRRNIVVTFSPGIGPDPMALAFNVASFPDRLPNDFDQAVIRDFQLLSFNALAEKARAGATYAPDEDLSHFRNFNVKYTWSEIWKKIMKIRNPMKYSGSGDLLGRFKANFATWESYQKALGPQSQGTNHNVTARTANEKHNDKPMVVPNVTESFKQLLQLKEPDSHGSKDLVRDRSNFMAQILTYCELVDTSDFMNQSLDVTGKYNRWRMSLGDSAVGFLGDLRQHIRRLRMYSAGMATYLNEGLGYVLPLFRESKNQQYFLDSFQINWINYSASRKGAQTHPVLTWTISPVDWLLGQLKLRAPDEDIDAQKLEALKKKVAGMWKVGEPIHGNVHCEVELVSYLTKHQIRARYNSIGTAKGVCWACQNYIAAMKECDFRYITCTSVSTKVSDEWIVPAAAGAPEGEWEKASMRRLCEELGSVCIYAILAHLE